MESIINSIIDMFSGLVSMKFGKELIVFIISLMPVLELRGGLIAASLLKLNPFIRTGWELAPKNRPQDLGITAECSNFAP